MNRQMIKRLSFFMVIAFFMLLMNEAIWGQIVLVNSPYLQNFDSLESGLSQGHTVRTGGTSSSLGTTTTFVTSKITWSASEGNFRNIASADGLTSTANQTTQNASTDRAMGLRQTGDFGDPGAAFVLELANTTGKQSFSLTFKFHTLDDNTRTTTFTVDYGVGATPTTFIPITTVTSGTFGNQTVTANFNSALDNQNGPVFIRIVALVASTGSSNRDTVGIDDINLSFVGPTAAAVEIGGRVTQPNNRGILNATVTMTDSQGIVRTTLTDMFGRFRFTDVAAGQTYVFSASHRRYQFEQPTQVQFVGEEIDSINFIGTGGFFNLNPAPDR